MSNLSQLRKAFRDVDAEDTGSIDRKQLSKVLSLAGLELTRAEFLEILEAVVNDEEKVDYKEFIQFFKSKMVSGSNSKYNRLIMKSVTGKAKTSSYDLPGKYHTYGIKNAKNDEPAKDVILTWVPFKSERTDNKKLNIVKMNKAAIKSKHVGVRDLMDYNREHPIYEKPGVSSSPTRTKSTKEMLGGSRSLPGGKAFGRVNEKDEPIYKLVNGEYVKGNEEEEPFYPANNPQTNRIRRKKEQETFDARRPTKASVGHASASRRLKTKPKAPFKMKRFANVEPRVRSNFASIGKSVVEDSK